MYKKHKGKRVDIMNGITMMIIAIVVLGGAYLLYGRYLQNKWGIDPKAKTPAYEMEDGVDYVPADTNVVFGHQFASIAGAGPINGPIQAAIFGCCRFCYGSSSVVYFSELCRILHPCMHP